MQDATVFVGILSFLKRSLQAPVVNSGDNFLNATMNLSANLVVMPLTL